MIRKIALGIGGAALVTAGAFWLTSPTNTLPALDRALVSTANAAEVEVTEMSIGNLDSSVEVVEYASFTCPHCATFHEGTYKDIKRDYIDTGKIKFTFRDTYWDKYALWAGLVARCGGEMRFFGIVEMIMSEQRDWATSKNPTEVVEKLRTMGRKAGLSNDQLDSCMRDQATAEALIAWSDKNSKADDVRGTPSFVINGKMYSNMSYAEFQKILDAELAK